MGANDVRTPCLTNQATRLLRARLLWESAEFADPEHGRTDALRPVRAIGS